MLQLFPTPGEVDPADAYGRLGRTDHDLPGVRLNMIASVDGAAWVQGHPSALGGPADKALFATLRSLADVILVGAGTVRTEGYGPVRLEASARARRERHGLPPVPPIAVITRGCRLEWSSRFFADAERRPIVVTVASAAESDRMRAAEVADVLLAGDDQVELRRTLTALGERGHDNVLSEGGPGIAAQLAAGDLLDDLCLTVSPMLTAGDADRVLDGPPLPSPARLRLAHVLEAGDYLFLRYRRP